VYDDKSVMAKLESAASRPRQSFEGHDAHTNLFEKVAALGHGISGGHVFGNGNKRTAFVAMREMLNVNGWNWALPAGLTAFVMLRTASNKSRMDVKELSDFVGSYSYIYRDRLTAQRTLSDMLVKNGYVIDDDPEVFPAVPPPVKSKKPIERRMRKSYRAHLKIMPKKEARELERTFNWPIHLDDVIKSWRQPKAKRGRPERKR